MEKSHLQVLERHTDLKASLGHGMDPATEWKKWSLLYTGPKNLKMREMRGVSLSFKVQAKIRKAYLAILTYLRMECSVKKKSLKGIVFQIVLSP